MMIIMINILGSMIGKYKGNNDIDCVLVLIYAQGMIDTGFISEKFWPRLTNGIRE